MQMYHKYQSQESLVPCTLLFFFFFFTENPYFLSLRQLLPDCAYCVCCTEQTVPHFFLDEHHIFLKTQPDSLQNQTMQPCLWECGESANGLWNISKQWSDYCLHRKKQSLRTEDTGSPFVPHLKMCSDAITLIQEGYATTSLQNFISEKWAVVSQISCGSRNFWHWNWEHSCHYSLPEVIHDCHCTAVIVTPKIRYYLWHLASWWVVLERTCWDLHHSNKLTYSQLRLL